MAKVTLVTEDSVWLAIQKAMRGRAPPLAAVAYVTSNRVPFRKGSVLVCNASESAVRTGQTNPKILSHYMRKGARIFSRPDLHAKIYVGSSGAVVGSANLSASSLGKLAEACVVLQGAGHVRSAERAILTLSEGARELDPVELRRLGSLYRPPKLPANRPTRSRLWRITTFEGYFSDDQSDAHNAGMPKAEQRLQAILRQSDARNWKLAETFFVRRALIARGLAVGDELIECHYDSSNEPAVWPIAKVVHIESVRDGRTSIIFSARRRGQHSRTIDSVVRRVPSGLARHLRARTDGARLSNQDAEIMRSLLRWSSS